MRTEAETRRKFAEVYTDDTINYDDCVAWFDALSWVLGEPSPVEHVSHYRTEKRPPLKPESNRRDR